MLGVLASYQISARLASAGARFRYTTGLPRTPVDRRLLRRARRFVPADLRRAATRIRIPAFYQLDVRVERSFVFRRGKLNIFLDVQNVTNRKNPEEIIYDTISASAPYITGLPTLAVLGARVEF